MTTARLNLLTIVCAKAIMTVSSANNPKAMLGVGPKVAMLSFSNTGSAEHALVDKVRTALKLVKERRPDLEMDGEIQSAAMIPTIGQKKFPGAKVAGHANAPVRQYLGKPGNDLHRGCTAEDAVNRVILALLEMGLYRIVLKARSGNSFPEMKQNARGTGRYCWIRGWVQTSSPFRDHPVCCPVPSPRVRHAPPPPRPRPGISPLNPYNQLMRPRQTGIWEPGMPGSPWVPLTFRLES